MWVNPLLKVLIDAAQSEQTSRTIRIVCTILVSLLHLIGLACLFLLVFVIEGQHLFTRGIFLVMGIWQEAAAVAAAGRNAVCTKQGVYSHAGTSFLGKLQEVGAPS